jgi:hypothetical protein
MPFHTRWNFTVIHLRNIAEEYENINGVFLLIINIANPTKDI